MLEVEPVSKRVSKWGEGPVWFESRMTYVDIAGKAVATCDPKTGDEKEFALDQNVGFAVPATSGKWIYGGQDGLFWLDMNSGISTPIVNPEPDLPENRFNDAKTSPDGRLFAGTMCPRTTPGKAKLYRVESDLRCTEVYSPVTISNGLAWSSDLKTAYYIDTPSCEIKAFDYDANSGTFSNCRTWIDTSDDPASPDGMCIDKDGNLWVAFCHGGCVKQYDTAAKKEIQKISFPVLETTSCAFGGEDGSDLYVTTGIHKTENEALAGKLFVIRDTGTSAPPASAFSV